jgi:hypothetical protein
MVVGKVETKKKKKARRRVDSEVIRRTDAVVARAQDERSEKNKTQCALLLTLDAFGYKRHSGDALRKEE